MNHFTLLIVLLLSCATSLQILGAEPAGKTLYHVVSIKFKEGTSVDQIKAVTDAFTALKTKIPGITSLHWGTNVSPENRNKGYTHCFVLTFASDKDRDTYLGHDEHKAFGGVLVPVLEDVTVIDFWSAE